MQNKYNMKLSRILNLGNYYEHCRQEIEVPSEGRLNLSQEEFNLQSDIIMRGFRVVIP